MSSDPLLIIKNIFDTESWVVQIFIVIFLTLLVAYLERRILNRLYNRLTKTTTHWDHAFIDALRRPLTQLIWVIGITFAIDIIQKNNPTDLFSAVGPLRKVAIIGLIAWFLIRFIHIAEENIVQENLKKGQTFDRTTMDAIAKLLRLSVIITATLVILQTLEFSISGVLAFGGIGGIAIGFAAKDLLANFFGGLMIYLDRPFNVGDWIRSPDREIEGTVEQIGWRLSMIRTFDKRPLYVPNSIFNNISVENPSRMSNRRIKEIIGIRYEDANKMDAIIKDVKTMLREHEEIDQGQTMIVNFNTFAPSSLDFFIYTFTKTTNWIRYHDIKQDVLLKVLSIIEKQGAECAFPTSTIHLYQQQPEARPTE